MNKNLLLAGIILIFSGMILPGFGQEIQPRDGRLLQGETCQPFVPTDKAYFYMATNGNDLVLPRICNSG